MKAVIEYEISPCDPAAHLYAVTLTITNPDPEEQRLTLPAWIPGSYMIRDFARNIVTISAHSSGEELQLRKLDKQTWCLHKATHAVQIRYQVYAWDLSVRAAHLDQTHGYFNGTSVFLRVIGQENNDHEVVIRRPEGPGFDSWRVATTLPQVDVDDALFGRYRASDYDTLVDFPVEMGTQTESAFETEGVQHRVTLTGRHSCDLDRLNGDLALICREHAAMFGELPVSQYLFMTLVTGDGYGGLEHRDSTSLMCARADLPGIGLAEPDEGYRRYLGLCSHEYFHLWNVKRIRPERLKPARLDAEVHTRLLWAFEGFTSYYDELGLVRSGCIDEKSYLDLLAQTVTRVMRGRGRMKQSVADSSFDAWTKFYKQDENAPNAIVSYYTKGALVAFGLDMSLRDATDGVVTLDDLMRALWQRHGKPDIGVPEDGVHRLASELAGQDLAEFFASYVDGVDELPLEQWFDSVGVGYALTPAKDSSDQGGVVDQAPENVEATPVLGARWADDAGAAKLSHVFEGGAGHQAGLSAGDRVIAIDGLQVNADNLAKRIAASDGALTVHAFRRDELMSFELTPQPAPSDTARLWLKGEADLSGAQAKRRQSWLSSQAK